MNITPFNPDDWMDVVALFGLRLSGLLAAVLPVWLNLRKQNRDLKTIKHEVKNDHGTNLRADIDRLTKAVETGFSNMERDISDLRKDVQQEREDRIEGDRLRLIRGHR